MLLPSTRVKASSCYAAGTAVLVLLLLLILLLLLLLLLVVTVFSCCLAVRPWLDGAIVFCVSQSHLNPLMNLEYLFANSQIIYSKCIQTYLYCTNICTDTAQWDAFFAHTTAQQQPIGF